jgi:hypothetical protein
MVEKLLLVLRKQIEHTDGCWFCGSLLGEFSNLKSFPDLDKDLLQLEINWRISCCEILVINEIQW